MTSRLALTAIVVVIAGLRAHAAAPLAPTNLAAIVNGNAVTLTWTPPATGTPATSYVVIASLSPGGLPIAGFPVTNPTLAVSGVPNGVYYVRVIAANAEGASGPSNEIVVVVPGGGGGCNAPPNAPTNFIGTVVGNLVTLAWAAPAAGCAPTGYAIQAGSSPGLSNIAVLNVGATTTLAVAAPPGIYYVRVLALNAFGASVPSAEIVITVGAATRVTLGFDGLAGVANQTPITTYSEVDFTVEANFGPWVALTTYGNPIPFIQFVRPAGTTSTFGQVTVRRAGSPFMFESVDLYSSVTPIPYEIIGVRNDTVVFTLAGTVPNTFGGFATVTNSTPTATVDALLIRLTNPGTACCSNPVGLDNIVLVR